MHQDAVIVGAVRTPVGLYGGVLAAVHPARLLGLVYGALLDRAGTGAAEVAQVVCGAETQTGEQADNVARTAWLAAGLPPATAALTVDGRELSGQYAAHLTAALVGSGAPGLGLSCAVEAMSRIPPATATQRGPGLPRPPAGTSTCPAPSRRPSGSRRRTGSGGPTPRRSPGSRAPAPARPAPTAGRRRRPAPYRSAPPTSPPTRAPRRTRTTAPPSSPAGAPPRPPAAAPREPSTPRGAPRPSRTARRGCSGRAPSPRGGSG
ncbi:hypothetical protein [Streptomyces sp. SA3_actG]|uniref:thiolase family protein n=1 Tax=Streptomyces sp. SA3_actG TaxID=683219 RepID=UPI00099619D8|nr:hypothetical protein [Streptomyces sp. SID4926]